MLNHLRSANREQRKLLLSVGTSVLTRIPGALGVLFFLPLVRFGLSTDDYAKMLTAMALGTAAGFLAGGFNYVGRRVVGEAYANRDQRAEADGFASLVAAQSMAAVTMLAVVVGYCWFGGEGKGFLLVATLTALIPTLGQVDDVRAAYNELYVSTTILAIFQVIGYTVGFVAPIVRHSILLSALVIVGPYLLSSLTSLVLLLIKRPYLVSGTPTDYRIVVRRGTMFAMADGFMMATLSISVVWLQATSTAETSAWYATIVRLFQIFLVPVILLLFPLSSYVRILWHRKTASQQQTFTKLTLVLGMMYGAVVSVALFAVSDLYLDWWLHLPMPVDLLAISPIFLLFGAIIAYKSYSQIAYIVLNETIHLSSWTTIAITAGVVVGAMASLEVTPMSAISAYAFVAGAATIVIVSWNAMRSIRLIRS